MKKGGGSESTIIIGPSNSVLVYALHSLEYVLGLAGFGVFVPNYIIYKFGERVISRNGSVGWPPRSCNLRPLDFFLSGYVKSMVYANKPATIDELCTNIEREIAAVSADL